MRVLALVLVCVAVTSACAGLLLRQYEYEEEMYLSLDGTATVTINASVAALVALRGVALDVDPGAPIDGDGVQALFEAPGATVSRVRLSRRGGRQFVHVDVEVDDVRLLSRVGVLSWSSYGFDARADGFEFRQIIGPAAQKPIPDVGWTGAEMVGFRMHVPSEILFNNAPHPVQRGNILEWEQSLAERLKGTPLDLRVRMAPESILYTTLLLFGSAIVAAVVAFALVIWWVVRKGGKANPATTGS